MIEKDIGMTVDEVREFSAELLEPVKAQIIMEIPEEITITEVLTEQGPKEQTTKKRVIKKKSGPKEEVTVIETIETPGMAPITTVSTSDIEIPLEKIYDFTQDLLKPVKANQLIEEGPEEITISQIMTEQGPQEQITKKKVIKKKSGPKESTTVIETIERPGVAPITTISTSEVEIPFEELNDLKLELLKPVKARKLTEESPEEIIISQIMTEQGPQEQITKKKIIKRKSGPKEETTVIETVEKPGMAPITTVTTTEGDIPFEKLDDFKPEPFKTFKAKQLIEDLPVEITITQVMTEQGLKEQITKKKVIKKKSGPKEEITIIETIEKPGMPTLNTVTTSESDIPLEKLDDFKAELLKPVTARQVFEDSPDEITITQIMTEQGPKEQITKKKVIKKKSGPKQEITVIETVEQPGLPAITTVDVSEIEIPLEKLNEFRQELLKPSKAKQSIEEYPDEITISQIMTEQGPQEQITKKKVIKKRSGPKEEITVIETVEKPGQAPVTTVTTSEVDIPLEKLDEFKAALLKPVTAQILMEDAPIEITITQIMTEQGPKEQITKKKVIKKKSGPKEETTVIETVERPGVAPITTVSVSEIDIPLENVKEFIRQLDKPVSAVPRFEEGPEEITITQIMTEQGPKEQVTKKKVIKKKSGPKEEITVIETIEQPGKAPITTVSTTEIDIPFEKLEEFKKELLKPANARQLIEESPDQITVTQIQTEQGMVDVIKKKKTIRKKSLPKEEKIEITTIEEPGKEPITSCKITELDLPLEEAQEFVDQLQHPQVANKTEDKLEIATSKLIESKQHTVTQRKLILQIRTIKNNTLFLYINIESHS